MMWFSTGGETHGSHGRGTESGPVYDGRVPCGTSIFAKERLPGTANG